MIPKQIKKVIEIFSKFPTIGEKTATRFVLYLLSKELEEIKEICKNILELKESVKPCSFCFSHFSPKGEELFCSLCQTRKEKTILILEKESDLWQIEKTGKFKGRYFILGGAMNFLKEDSLGAMRLEELKKRIEEFEPEEIILALNPTPSGVLTMDYLLRILKPYKIKISRLAIGLPTGGEIEYSDEETIEKALEGRR